MVNPRELARQMCYGHIVFFQMVELCCIMGDYWNC